MLKICFRLTREVIYLKLTLINIEPYEQSRMRSMRFNSLIIINYENKSLNNKAPQIKTKKKSEKKNIENEANL